MKFKSDIEVQAGLKDSSGSAGSSGQILTSTGTQTFWVTTPITPGTGGSSQVFYFNGSIASSVAGYKQMSTTAYIGGGMDFSINANGYIASFLTDVNSPNQLNIPAGNWNFEIYMNASSSGNTPRFYVELYKYDSGVFTLIASNSATPEYITNGVVIDLYMTALAVPATVLTVTDRLAVRVYVINSGKTITMHTEDSHLCEVITTFSTGISALNGLTPSVQYFASNGSGADFNIVSSGSTHTFNLPTASSTKRGALSSIDWTTFNNKQGTITLTTTGTSGAATFSGGTLNIPQYTADPATYIQNQNASAQSANMWISGSGTFGSNVLSNGWMQVRKANPSFYLYNDITANGAYSLNVNATGTFFIGNDNTAQVPLSIASSGAATFASSVTATSFKSTGRCYSTGDNTYGDLASTNGAIVMSYDSVNQIGSINARNYTTSTQLNLQLGTSLTVLGGGNVGIGTTTPTSARLQVKGDNGTAIGYFFNNTGTAGQVLGLAVEAGTNSSDYALSIASSLGTPYLRVRGDGNVGIGTTTPDNGTLTILKATSRATESSYGLAIQSDSRNIYTELLLGADDSVDCGIIQTASKNTNFTGKKLALQPQGGNVGIGTTSPSVKLQIAQTASGTTNNLTQLITSSDGGKGMFQGIDITNRKFYWRVNDSDDYGYAFQNAVGGNLFSIVNTGAATFASSVSVGSIININNPADNAVLNLNTYGNYTYPQGQIKLADDGAYGGHLVFSNKPTGANANALVERMRITSGGKVGIGTSNPSYKLSVLASNNVSWLEDTSGSNGATFVLFSAPSATGIGSISRVGTTNAVAYNTVSDYRLKEDLKEIKGLDKISKIKVYDFKWKDHTARMDGVLAHELQEIVPYAVTGEKDAEQMQSVDYSKLVPILVQAIQELKAEIEILKNK